MIFPCDLMSQGAIRKESKSDISALDREIEHLDKLIVLWGRLEVERKSFDPPVQDQSPYKQGNG